MYQFRKEKIDVDHLQELKLRLFKVASHRINTDHINRYS